MAIMIDDWARAAIARRRAHGQDDTLFLRVDVLPVRGVSHIVAVDWASRRRPQRTLAVRQVGDVLVYVGRRLARYTQWHDVTITASRLGPFERLRVVDEPRVLLEMQAWEQTHPAVGQPPAA